MRVLVTGAAGLAGRTIARRLASHGLDVVAQWRDTPLALDHPRITHWRADLAAIEALPDGVTALVHGAARSPATGGVMPPPSVMVHDNVLPGYRLANLVSRRPDMRVVHLSSSSILGRIEVERLTEDTPTIDPDLYGETKRLAERMLTDAADAVISLRLPAIIGPGATRNWTATVMGKLKGGQHIRIFNADAPFNNVIHAEDIAAFAEHYLTAPTKLNDGLSEVLIGSGTPVTVRGVVETMAAVLGIAPEIEVAPASKTSFTIDISAARAMGFAPMDTKDALETYAREESRL